MNARPQPVPGFRFSGTASGIKADQSLDVGLVVADHPCTAAGVFTQNLVQAAPVQLSRVHLESGRARAVVVNSGNANACTGEAGQQASMRTAQTVADLLNCPTEAIQVGSTGVIGVPLPVLASRAG